MYKLSTLPEEIKAVISLSHHVKNIKEHRTELKHQQAMETEEETNDLFSSFLDDEKASLPDVEITNSQVIWGTDNYESKGTDYSFEKPVNDLTIIVPRVEKSKAEQKRRVKEKAEVFTPSWVCNVQNNLVDDHILYKGAFNSTENDEKLWEPSETKVKFDKKYTWLDYVVSRRLEMTCGEAPYLMSPYDTTTGDHIPVRNENGHFMRIGVLDRKLRIVTENSSKKKWVNYAMVALATTFGYEWQGDNLLLARLNFINTYIDYYTDVFGKEPDEDNLLEVAEIASWNLWQMDGLKMVEPLSCSDKCKNCKNKKKAGHDGQVSAIRFLTADGLRYKSFEELLPSNEF